MINLLNPDTVTNGGGSNGGSSGGSSGGNAGNAGNGGNGSVGSSKVGLIIGVVMAGVVLLIGTFITFVYCIRRRSKIAEKMVSDDEGMQ